jgi:serine/threonine protein kinase
MEAKLAPSANLLALPDGTELVGDYRIRQVLGAGGFGITYLADETALGRRVTIKEYFPAEFAARRDQSAAPRSRDLTDDYQWGLDRFIEEAQTLARFDHPNIVRVHRYFHANNTAYMVLHFEEGGSFKAWLKRLKRAPRQGELDTLIAPLLDALETIHDADFLHRDIAPDNIMVRKDGSPVLIDFGSARGAVACHSRTISALVKPGYSPYEQYATTGANQGPWTDIYALGATLYHAITGKRPPDAPSRVVSDDYVPAPAAARGSYRSTFLDAIDRALRIEVGERPQRIAEWRGALLAPAPVREPEPAAAAWPLARVLGRLRKSAPTDPATGSTPRSGAPDVPDPAVPASLVPTPPDAPQRQGQLLDFIEALKRHRPSALGRQPKQTAGEPTDRQNGPPEPLGDALHGAHLASDATPAPPQGRLTPRSKPRPWRIPARRWRVALFRIAAAVAVSSLAVAYQESIRRSAALDPSAASSNAAAGFTAKELVGHQGPVIGVGSADQDQWLVSAGADATIRVWSAASGAIVRTIDLGEGAVTAFAVDGRRALVGHKGGAIVLWDLERGERLATSQLGGDAITSLAFLGEGFVAACQDGSLAVFKAGARVEPIALLESAEHGGHLIAAAHTRSLFVSSGFDRTVRVWRASGPHLVRSYRHLSGDITAIDVAPDARYMAGGTSEGAIRIWASPALRSVQPRAAQTMKAHTGRVDAIALGPSGILASAGEDGTVKLWSLNPARIIGVLPGALARTLGFSRDGRRLLAGGQDGVVRVWSLTSPSALGAI